MNNNRQSGRGTRGNNTNGAAGSNGRRQDLRQRDGMHRGGRSGGNSQSGFRPMEPRRSHASGDPRELGYGGENWRPGDEDDAQGGYRGEPSRQYQMMEDEDRGGDGYGQPYGGRDEREHRGYGGEGARGYGSQEGSQQERDEIYRPQYGQTYGTQSDWGQSYQPHQQYGTSGGAYGGMGGQQFGGNGTFRGNESGFGGPQGGGAMGGMQGRGMTGDWGMGSQKKRGTGPKGYKRSDERIKEDVSDRLMEMGEIDASDVEVAVSGGEVTLTGTVPDRAMKYRIEHLCDQVSGVVDINNQLKVKRGEGFGGGSTLNGGTALTQEKTARAEAGKNNKDNK